MGGVPKQRHTKSRWDRRRMHIFLQAPSLVFCPHCKRMKPPHIVCPNCGYYRGVERVNVLEKLEKKERKKREREIKETEKEKVKEEKKKPLTLEELSKKKF